MRTDAASRAGAGAGATPITISEEAGIRYLHFGSPWVQGAMRIARPDELVLEYVRQMMAWTLFLAPPARILQLGLGAGSLARFTLARCARSSVTVVERSPEVIDTARDWFALPGSVPRLRIVAADAGEFVERAAERGRYGVLQVDLYDRHARGPVLESGGFYRACAGALEEPGVLVVNLFGRHASHGRNLRRIARVFGGRCVEMPAVREGNRVVVAFKGPPIDVGWAQLRARALEVEREFSLSARAWVRALRDSTGTPRFAV